MQYPGVILLLRSFSILGDNLGSLSEPGISWCRQTGTSHESFFIATVLDFSNGKMFESVSLSMSLQLLSNLSATGSPLPGG